MLKKLIAKFRSSGKDTRIGELERAIEWLYAGGVGASSKALLWNILNDGYGQKDPYSAYPHDVGDFGRCIDMLTYMGWTPDRVVSGMRGVSDKWELLRTAWLGLTETYAAEKAGAVLKGTTGAMIRHLTDGKILATFDPKQYHDYFTYAVDMPYIYSTDRKARGLTMQDKTFPLPEYALGTHRWRVFLTINDMREWQTDARERATTKGVEGRIRTSALKAADALANAIYRWEA